MAKWFWSKKPRKELSYELVAFLPTALPNQYLSMTGSL